MALREKLTAKILKLEAKIDQLKHGIEIEEDLPIRRSCSLRSDDNHSFPLYSRTDMFDYKANNQDIYDCIRAPVEESYGLRNDHHTYLDSKVVLSLESNELRQQGTGA